MIRLLTITIFLLVADVASAQCQPWYPLYPVAPPGYLPNPALWGAPAPKPLPPLASLPVPKAKPAPAIKEEDEPSTTPPAPKSKSGLKEPGEDKDKETPRIPKTKLPIPGDRLDKGLPDLPKSDSPKVDPPKTIPEGKSFEQYMIPAEGKGEPPALVKVGFFNHTERQLVLDVNGQSLRLPKGEYATVRLPRTFTWAEQGAKDNSVVVPPDAEGIEIVFRK